MSGLSFRDKIDFAFSAVSVVSTRSASSPSASVLSSSKRSRRYCSNRPDSFDRDDRPRAEVWLPRSRSDVACLFILLINPSDARSFLWLGNCYTIGRLQTAATAGQVADRKSPTRDGSQLVPLAGKSSNRTLARRALAAVKSSSI